MLREWWMSRISVEASVLGMTWGAAVATTLRSSELTREVVAVNGLFKYRPGPGMAFIEGCTGASLLTQAFSDNFGSCTTPPTHIGCSTTQGSTNFRFFSIIWGKWRSWIRLSVSFAKASGWRLTAWSRVLSSRGCMKLQPSMEQSLMSFIWNSCQCILRMAGLVKTLPLQLPTGHWTFDAVNASGSVVGTLGRTTFDATFRALYDFYTSKPISAKSLNGRVKSIPKLKLSICKTLITGLWLDFMSYSNYVI